MPAGSVAIKTHGASDFGLLAAGTMELLKPGARSLRSAAEIRSRAPWRAVRWALRVTLALLLVGFASCRVVAQEFSGYGPIPTRNFQPIQQIFLNLPFERARTLGVGEMDLRLQSAESNEIATNQEQFDALLKFEQNRTVVGATLGLAKDLDVGLDVPFISRFGGFLDPPIDTIEALFGTSNVERKQYPNNSFAGFYVREHNGRSLFEGPRQQFELGDIWASAKYLVLDSEDLPRLALRAAVKAPSGRAHGVFGSGKPDFGLGFAIDHQFLDWLIAYGNFNVIYPLGPITNARLTLNPMVTGGVAGEANLGCGVSFVLQQNTYTSPIHGTGTRLLDGTAVELAAALNWDYAPVLMQLSMIDNISPVATSADFTLLLQLTWYVKPQA